LNAANNPLQKTGQPTDGFLCSSGRWALSNEDHAMKLTSACRIILVARALAIPGRVSSAEGTRELRVHLAQANNNSPYAFVRARFNPGEVVDPWAVRFFDAQGKEIPYFVWDSVTWRVAREGRADWEHRYALLNHAPGDASAGSEARAKKIAGAVPTSLDVADLLTGMNEHCAKLRVVPPQSKRLACGDIGLGALAAVDEIVAAVQDMLSSD